MLGIITATSILCSCTTDPPEAFWTISGDIRNESSSYVVIVPHDKWFYGAYGYGPRNIAINSGENFEGLAAYGLMCAKSSRTHATFSVVSVDSVIEVQVRDSLHNRDSAFMLKNHSNDGALLNHVLIFTDEYLAELADTMRAMGIPPYRVSHEYVVNSTRHDFTLRCVSAERTWEYKIASGDSADIERRWLMEWYGTEGGHYEFVFADRTMTVWPAEIFGFSLRDVVRGHKAIPHRYFDFTVSREGGGVRRYEITDTLLRQMATEMAKVRKAQPGLFGR